MPIFTLHYYKDAKGCQDLVNEDGEIIYSVNSEGYVIYIAQEFAFDAKYKQMLKSTLKLMEVLYDNSRQSNQ